MKEYLLIYFFNSPAFNLLLTKMIVVVGNGKALSVAPSPCVGCVLPQQAFVTALPCV